MTYLLDTNICVFFLRDQFGIKETIRTIGYKKFAISEITVLELLYGAEKSPNAKERLKATENFLQGIEILPIFPLHKLFAEEKVALEKKGKPLHDNFDLLIGLTAVYNQLTLVTENLKHFQNIRNLEIENWIKR